MDLGTYLFFIFHFTVLKLDPPVVTRQMSVSVQLCFLDITTSEHFIVRLYFFKVGWNLSKLYPLHNISHILLSECHKMWLPKYLIGFPGSSVVKNPPVMQEMWVRCLGWEDLLGKETATHSSILAWEIYQRSLEGYSPWSLKRVGHDLATKITKNI